LLLVLTAFAMALHNTTLRVNDELFEARWLQESMALDMMCDNIDNYVKRDGDWYEYNYMAIVGDAVKRLGMRQGVYAALYDQNLVLLVGRGNGETDRVYYRPLITGGDVETVRQSERGALDVEHVSDGGKVIPARLYYRWIPTGKYDDKMLVAVAVTDEELGDSPAGDLLVWNVALLAFSALSVITSAFMLTQQTQRPKEESDARL
jgi:hypothetical protein